MNNKLSDRFWRVYFNRYFLTDLNLSTFSTFPCSIVKIHAKRASFLCKVTRESQAKRIRLGGKGATMTKEDAKGAKTVEGKTAMALIKMLRG